MFLNNIDKNNIKYIELDKILAHKGFNLTSFLNMVEFNLLLDPTVISSSFNINTFIDEVYDIINDLNKKVVPQKYNSTLLNNLDIRKLIVSLQGFSLVSKDWVHPFKDWIGNRKVLEIMSGLGVLSSALREEGVDLISTDDYTATNFDFNTLWTNIEKLDALTAIEKYGKETDIIIMSWCYTDETGYNCLKKMREVNPNAVMIYIGEGVGGSTGSLSLYENMIEINDEAIHRINSLYPTWFGVHDKLYLIK